MDNDIKKYILTIIIALVGSTGINQGIQMYSPNARNDPFTGTDGKLLRAEIYNEFAKSQRSEEIECAQYRTGIEKRLSRTELLQEHVIKELNRRGINLTP